MKRFSLTLLLTFCVISCAVFAQSKTDYSKIDLMLIRGNYVKVIHTCQLILKSDSLNPEIYYKTINDLKKSAYYYQSIIRNFNPMLKQLSYSHVSLAEILKTEGIYKEAVDSYLLGQKLSADMNIDMIVANLYDEKINDIPKALYYYQLFMDANKNNKRYSKKYIEKIQARIDYLKEKQTIATKK